MVSIIPQALALGSLLRWAQNRADATSNSTSSNHRERLTPLCRNTYGDRTKSVMDHVDQNYSGLNTLVLIAASVSLRHKLDPQDCPGSQSVAPAKSPVSRMSSGLREEAFPPIQTTA